MLCAIEPYVVQRMDVWLLIDQIKDVQELVHCVGARKLLKLVFVTEMLS